MKKFETRIAQDTLAKSQKAIGEKVEAPVVLTLDQIEAVAAVFTLGKGPTTVSGGMPVGPYMGAASKQ